MSAHLYAVFYRRKKKEGYLEQELRKTTPNYNYPTWQPSHDAEVMDINRHAQRVNWMAGVAYRI